MRGGLKPSCRRAGCTKKRCKKYFAVQHRASEVRDGAHRQDDADGHQRPLEDHRRRQLAHQQGHPQLQDDLRRVGRTRGTSNKLA